MNILVVVFILLTLDAATCTSESSLKRKCTEGWELFGTKCYKYITKAKTWAEAEQYCISLGGNLASVHSKQTHEFLKRMTKSSTGQFDYVWIGLHDAPQEYVWLWSDGSKFDFNAWHSGEPNNAEWAERCVEMNYGDEILWNDIRCSNSLYFMCQKGAKINLLSI